MIGDRRLSSPCKLLTAVAKVTEEIFSPPFLDHHYELGDIS